MLAIPCGLPFRFLLGFLLTNLELELSIRTVVSTDSDMGFFLGILSTRSPLVRSWRFSLEKSTADCTDSDGAGTRGDQFSAL